MIRWEIVLLFCFISAGIGFSIALFLPMNKSISFKFESNQALSDVICEALFQNMIFYDRNGRIKNASKVAKIGDIIKGLNLVRIER